MDSPPLVSVIVISYNSSETVLETLESVKKQTYQNIELIVSDDCSTDNTQSVVTHWLESNGETLPFKRSVLIRTPQNGGPAINSNHGVRNANGKWYKLIAADDILLPDCISRNVEYVTKHDDAQILLSRMEYFGGSDNMTSIHDDIYCNFWKLTRKQQYHLILLDNWITAPSQFVRKDVWDKLGEYDKKIPFIEDWPFWIKAFKAGVKFDFLDEPTVKYRIHESLSDVRSPSKKYLESLRLTKEYAHSCQYEISPLFRYYDYVRDNIHSYIIQRILFIWNPYYWYIKYVNYLTKD